MIDSCGLYIGWDGFRQDRDALDCVSTHSLAQTMGVYRGPGGVGYGEIIVLAVCECVLDQ